MSLTCTRLLVLLTFCKIQKHQRRLSVFIRVYFTVNMFRRVSLIRPVRSVTSFGAPNIIMTATTSSCRFHHNNNNPAASSSSCSSPCVSNAAPPAPLRFPLPLGTLIRDVSKNIASTEVAACPTAAVGPGATVTMRGRVQACRVKGKLGFLLLRQPPYSDTIQVVIRDASSNEPSATTTSAAAASTLLLPVARTLTPESIVEITGTLASSDRPITSATCMDLELHATDLRVISLAETPLPFPLKDVNTKLDTRLDHRIMDLRTVTTSAIVQLVSVANRVFRDVLAAQQFVEIHTPKLLGTPSEGGSAVFELGYFDKRAFLAQSPQLYKQMMLMGDAMRVFEVGPVFRAEKSLTHRHLTEFVGLDAEMVVQQSYTEVLDVLEMTLVSMVDALEAEVQLVNRVQEARAAADPSFVRPQPIVARVPKDILDKFQFGQDQHLNPINTTTTTVNNNHNNLSSSSVDPYGARVSSLHSPFPVLRLTFANAMQMLVDAKEISEALDDFSVAMERALGKLIKARYGVDVYIVDQFPVSARPFYTGLILEEGETSAASAAGEEGWKVSPQTRTRSYDMYLRGEEICSGAQRIHDPKLLEYRMRQCNVDVSLIRDYVNSFRYGAWPHGGFGLGLERIVMFFLDAQDIRQVSLFPRDPKRITP